jgi:hypothetical protein
MRRFNQLLAQVRENRNKQYSKNVEDATYKMLAERYKMMLGVRRKNSHKHHHHVLPDSDAEEEEDDDDSVVPEDELILLCGMEQV